MPLCDGCFNARAAALAGMPPPPAPPAPIVLTGPDGRAHRMRFRLLWAPVGIELMLDEADVNVGEGYRFAVLGDFDADVDALVAQVQAIAEREVARQYLEPAEHGTGWMVTEDDEVAGRLVWSDEGRGAPYDVVIDGRLLTWEEFGAALGPYEGWNFRLVIEDRVAEARSDAKVIELARRRHSSGKGP
jgi:hypothetical protein